MSEVPAVTIGVRYSCDACGIDDDEVQVPARDPREDVMAWMHTMEVYLAEDHRRKSPGCHPERLTNVKIPISGDIVGGRRVN